MEQEGEQSVTVGGSLGTKHAFVKANGALAIVVVVLAVALTITGIALVNYIRSVERVHQELHTSVDAHRNETKAQIEALEAKMIHHSTVINKLIRALIWVNSRTEEQRKKLDLEMPDEIREMQRR